MLSFPHNIVSTTRLAVAGLLLGALPLASRAQNQTQAELLRNGDLVGGRPHASVPRTAAGTTQVVRGTTDADPGLTKLIHQSVDLNRATAGEMPGLYNSFIDATREQRRQWTDRDWTDASATLGRLNTRYEVVRQDIDFEDRLRIRSLQGEFRTLQGARRVNQKLDEKNVNVK